MSRPRSVSAVMEDGDLIPAPVSAASSGEAEPRNLLSIGPQRPLPPVIKPISSAHCLHCTKLPEYVTVMFYLKVSLYLRIPLVGRYVFICFHSFHSQFLQFDFMPRISVWFTVGFYYLETRPVFLILHASYLHFHTLLIFREKYLLGFKNISVFLLCKVLIYVLCQQCNECIS